MDDDAMNNESNRTGVTRSFKEKIARVMKQFKLSEKDAISFILSNEESNEAEEGDKKLLFQRHRKQMNMATEPKASGGSVKKSYAYGGRVAAMSAEKS